MKFYTFQIIIEREEDPREGYFAYSPQVRGCYSNGATIEETRRNIREAIELHLSALQEEKGDLSNLSSAPSLYKEELVIGVPA